MSLPLNSNIINTTEGNQSIYTIPLLKRMNSIIMHFIGIIMLASYVFSIVMSNDATLSFKSMLMSFFLVITVLDSIMILWVLYGKEIVIIENEQLIIKNVLYNVGITRKFDISKIEEARINIKYQHGEKVKMNILNMFSLIGYNRGFVTFRYGNKDVAFGTSLNVEEAHYFTEMLQNIKKQSIKKLIPY